MGNENLASDIIKMLARVIVALIITNVLTIAGFLIYLSIPVECGVENCYQNATDYGKNSYVGGDSNVGYTDSDEDTSILEGQEKE